MTRKRDRVRMSDADDAGWGKETTTLMRLPSRWGLRSSHGTAGALVASGLRGRRGAVTVSPSRLRGRLGKVSGG